MKIFLPLLVSVLLMGGNNTAFAIVVKNADPIFTPHGIAKLVATKEKKTDFIQRSIPNIVAKKLQQKEKTKKSVGDKLANWGFWSSIVGVSVVLLRLLIDAIGVVVVDGGIIAVLSILAAYAILVGFIICLVAIKRKSITAHGKARAKIGIWIFPFFILIALILTIAAITSYG